MGTLADLAKDLLAPRYDNFPRGRYANLIVVRRTDSEAIFRTEGSGEDLSKETVLAGVANAQAIRRVVISKRKQVAVERRTGRELLREHELLYPAGGKGQVCALNTNTPCGKCIDCMLYGFAVGGGDTSGAQKSRVMTEDAYSIGPVTQITGRRTFNATFENGTMRNPLTGEASTSLGEDEYVLPQTHFLDIETLKDVTEGELEYVLANVLRTSRYGAISSRQGRVRNRIVAVIFSDCEIFSNLELTQTAFDRLIKDDDLPFPLPDADVDRAARASIDALLPAAMSRAPVIVDGDRLAEVLAVLQARFQDRSAVAAWLRAIETGYGNS